MNKKKLFQIYSSSLVPGAVLTKVERSLSNGWRVFHIYLGDDTWYCHDGEIASGYGLTCYYLDSVRNGNASFVRDPE